MAIITIPLPSPVTADTDMGTLSGDGVDLSLDLQTWADVVRWIGAETGMSGAVLGGRIGVNARAVRAWRAAKDLPMPPSRRLLLSLAREVLLRQEREGAL